MKRAPALLLLAVLLLSARGGYAQSLSDAREAFLRGENGRAAEVLAQVKEANGTEAPYAAYLLGHIRYTEREFEAAALAFEEAEGLPIRHYARYYRAESLFWAHDAAAARRLFASISTDPESPFAPWAKLRVADSDLALGDPSLAAREYQAFLAEFPSYSYPEAIAFALAECARRTGNTARAAEIYLSLWVKYPHTRYAALAMQARTALDLDGGPAPAPSLRERVERARNLRDQRLHEQALAELDTLKRELLASSFAGDAALMVSIEVERGRTLLRLAKGDEAAEALASAADSSEMARRYLGDAYAIAGKPQEAAAAYAKHLGVSGAARGKEIRPYADFLFDVGLYKEARAEYDKLPSRDEDVAFRLAWCDYRSGEYDRAVDGLRALAKRGSSYKDLSAYWIARIAERKGDQKTAIAGYRALLADDETSYYGILARSRLVGLGELTVTASQPADNSHVKIVRPTEQEVEAAFSSLRASPRGKEASARAYVFYRLGLEGNAREELETVYYEGKSGKGAAFRSRSPYFPANWSKENSKDSLLLASAVKEGTVGDPSAVSKKTTKRAAPSKKKKGKSSAPSTFAESASGAEALGGEPEASGNFWTNLGVAFSGVGDAHYPMYLLSAPAGKRYYPQAYPDAVLPIGDEFDHTPEELWALMHTESTFHRFVASRVGAIGLMQIMPKTGRAIALRLGFDDFRPGQLFDAKTNLHFAGWYYRQLKEVFQGQLPLAMAAYNGGPYMIGRIIRAKTWTKPELDEIVEEIPARESRLYAKKVMYKTSKYQKLYQGETHLVVDLTLNTTVGGQVDF